jgi:WD40 repeat protein
MLIGADDGTVSLIDSVTGKELRHFDGHSQPVSAVALSQDGKFALSGSLDKTSRLWDVETGQQILVMEEHNDSVYDVAFGPNDETAFTGAMDGQVIKWNLKNGHVVTRLSGHDKGATSIAVEAASGIIVSGSLDRSVRIWHGPDYAPSTALQEGHLDEVHALAFNSKGHLLATGSKDKTVRIWDIKKGQQIWRQETPMPLASLAGHGNTLIGALGNRFALISYAMGFGAMGGKVPSGSPSAGSVVTWDLQTGQQSVLGGHSGAVRAVAFSRDGRQILSASDDATVRT